MGSRFIVGLDIGTAAIKAVVAERENGKPLLRAALKEPSAGMRKGAIIEPAELTPAVARVLGEVKQVAKPALKALYVNIGTPQLKAQSSRGIVAVSRADSEIYQDDIDRAVRASQAVSVGPNRMVVHNVTREYIVDGIGDIADPLGLSGNRLEVSSLVIDAFAPHVKSLMRVVELAGGQIGGLVANPLPASRAVLSKTQRDLGVALVDVGFGTTGMSVYEENKLVGIAVLPVGAGHVTTDLAVGLKIPVEAAENVKLHAGYAVAKEVGAKEAIDLSKFAPEAKGMVSRRFVAEIIESRLAETFELVNNELRLWGKAAQLPAGAVLTGGGAKLPGLTDLAKSELKLSSQIGFASDAGWERHTDTPSDIFNDPEFAGALGLVLWGMERERWNAEGSGFRVKNLLRYFLP